MSFAFLVTLLKKVHFYDLYNFTTPLQLISCPPEMKNGDIDPNQKSDSNWGLYNKSLLLKFTIFISEI